MEKCVYAIHGPVLGPHGRYYWAEHDGMVYSRDVKGEKSVVAEIECFICCISLSRDGKSLLVGGYEGTGNVIDLATKKVVALAGHADCLYCIISGEGGDVITGSTDGTVRVWDGVSGECKLTLKGHTNRVTSLLFDAVRRRIISGSGDETIRVWDYRTGVQIEIMKGHASFVRCLAWINKTTIVSGSYDGTMKVWDLSTLTCARTIDVHSSCIQCVAVTPDGDYLISGSWDKAMKITRIATGECVHTLVLHSDHVLAVAVSPDGCLIASGGGDKTLNVLRVSPPFAFVASD